MGGTGNGTGSRACAFGPGRAGCIDLAGPAVIPEYQIDPADESRTGPALIPIDLYRGRPTASHGSPGMDRQRDRRPAPQYRPGRPRP